jgi:multiple sugar transport system ATP-binding protein
MATIKFDKVYITYPDQDEPTVKDFNLDIKDGEFIVIVGPSGCGKSTTLRALAGLEPVSSGKIYINNKDVTNLAPKDRDIAMVFQNYALYPHMTVEKNIGFALKIKGIKKDVIKQKVKETAELLGLTEYLNKKPKQLSGGQRQRVAMGRAIVRKPHVFLMDEPLSNLDTKLRVSTRTQIASLQDKLQVSTVYVTHDQTEAMTMGDRIIVMKDGIIQQIGTPDDQYLMPNNVFVAGFIGSPAMNIGVFPVENGYTIINRDHKLKVPDNILELLNGQKKVIIGVRPENLEVIEDRRPREDSIPIYVDVVENMGSDIYGYGHIIDINENAKLKSNQVIVRTPGFSPIRQKETIYCWPSAIHYFSATTEERIGEQLR